MRKTADLVEEMQTEAGSAWLVAIAVGFPDDTRFVFSTNRNALSELNALAGKGGYPVGLLRFILEGKSIQGYFRPFAEYEGQEWVGAYLAGLLDHTDEIIAMSRNVPG